MRLFVFSVTAVLALGLSGCEKEEQKERAAEPVASVDKAAAVDPALAKAMAQASAAPRAKRGPSTSTTDGPPPTGIFEPGAADREAKLGSAPKITLGGNGSEPRVTLGPSQPKPGWKTAGSMQVVLQPPDPRQPALPVQVALTLEAQKPKAGDAGAEAQPVADAVAVTARVKSAEIVATGIPQELAARIAALKGAKIEYLVAPDGSGSGYRYDLPAGANDLVDYLRALSDTLALVTLPTPNVPLGQGGFWMTTTREGVYGLDLVTYRMVKVEKLEGDQATLSVSTKRYAASDRFEFAGLPSDVPRELLEFDAKSDGRLEIKAGAPFPSGGEIGSLLAAKLGTPERAMMLQVQSRVGLAFGAKPAPASKPEAPAPNP
ncbi:MAG TPA: hypothetical protein VFZ53_19760 [Polyangiaceae bacterium]